MLLINNLRLSRLLIYTWKTDLMLAASCTAAYFANEYLVKSSLQIPPLLPTIMGTAIAFFIGFNNNQAYSRWWEARIIWGALVNDSRSWARSILNYLSPVESLSEPISTIQKIMILRHIGFIYALRTSLRKSNDEEYKKFLSEEDKTEIKNHINIPNAIVSLQSRDLQGLSTAGSMDGLRFTQFNQLIVNFTDSMGRSERINNTVFPTVYIYFTRIFIWLFVVLITLVFSNEVGPWSIFMAWLIGFVFHSTHSSGMLLMNPFESIPSGIPLNSITRSIEINLLQMLGEKNIPEPVKPIDGEYLL